MKKAAIIGMGAFLVLGAVNGQGAEINGHVVVIYLQDHQLVDPLLLHRAEALATEMFGEIGVRLRWELPGRRRAPAPDAEVVLRFATRTPAGFHPGAQAYSFPYAPPSEVRVVILCDRVLQPGVADRGATAAFLGHVLTHEVAHVLQGVTRHSEAGVMKPRFTPQDRAAMRKGPLPFTAYDADLIRSSIANAKGSLEIAAR